MERWRYARAVVKIAGWVALVYIVIYQVRGPARLEADRARKLEQLQQQRGSQVIALIHRQETFRLFGVPVSSSISIEDSEAVLRAIRHSRTGRPIDVILHTPGGLLLASEQIARALVDHQAKVTVFVPHYAMSGGAMIALAADEIVMDPNAVLGPVDPQIGDIPAASILRLLELKPASQISDEMLIRADVAIKAQSQTRRFVAGVLSQRQWPKEKAEALAHTLTDGRWTHDFPITVATAREMGLPVTLAMPESVYELMDLYPQSGEGRPTVLYVPMRQGAPAPGDPAKP